MLRNNAWDDLEDGLQMQCAADEDLDYIITCDKKGFETAKTQVISPEIFLRFSREDTGK